MVSDSYTISTYLGDTYGYRFCGIDLGMQEEGIMVVLLIAFSATILFAIALGYLFLTKAYPQIEKNMQRFTDKFGWYTKFKKARRIYMSQIESNPYKAKFLVMVFIMVVMLVILIQGNQYKNKDLQELILEVQDNYDEIELLEKKIDRRVFPLEEPHFHKTIGGKAIFDFIPENKRQ